MGKNTKFNETICLVRVKLAILSHKLQGKRFRELFVKGTVGYNSGLNEGRW